ncbi:transporter substrate-binding domain-containing protein [Alteromonadaceae bacterium M269]|nr:transporter substrate-binding domain-containing protein [Alteromonadaceae bacterium M269]
MILIRRYVLTLSVCLFSLATASKEAITLRAGLPNFPPFSYINEQGINAGAIVDYVELLENKAQIELEVVHMPYARLVRSLATGDIDIGILFLNDALADDVRYVAEVSMSKVIVLPRKEISLNHYDDLYYLSNIAVIRSANFHKQFDADKMINKVYVNDYEQGIRLLELGRVDAIVGSISGLDYASQSLGKGIDDWGKPLDLANRQWWLHMSNASKNISTLNKLKMSVDELYEPFLVYKLYNQHRKTN